RPPSSVARASSLSVERAARTTRYPAAAACRAVASPIPLEAPVIRKTLASGAMHLSGRPPVLRRDAVDEHVDVLRRGAARLVQRLRHRLDDLRDGLVGDARVVELDVDPGHGLLLSSWTESRR